MFGVSHKDDSSDDISLNSTLESEDMSDEEFIIGDLLADKYSDIHNDRVYLVKWKSYPLKRATWEPIESFSDPSIVDNYLARKKRGELPEFDYQQWDREMEAEEIEKQKRKKKRMVKRKLLALHDRMPSLNLSPPARKKITQRTQTRRVKVEESSSPSDSSLSGFVVDNDSMDDTESSEFPELDDNEEPRITRKRRLRQKKDKKPPDTGFSSDNEDESEENSIGKNVKKKAPIKRNVKTKGSKEGGTKGRAVQTSTDGKTGTLRKKGERKTIAMKYPPRIVPKKRLLAKSGSASPPRSKRLAVDDTELTARRSRTGQSAPKLFVKLSQRHAVNKKYNMERAPAPEDLNLININAAAVPHSLSNTLSRDRDRDRDRDRERERAQTQPTSIRNIASDLPPQLQKRKRSPPPLPRRLGPSLPCSAFRGPLASPMHLQGRPQSFLRPQHEPLQAPIPEIVPTQPSNDTDLGGWGDCDVDLGPWEPSDHYHPPLNSMELDLPLSEDFNCQVQYGPSISTMQSLGMVKFEGFSAEFLNFLRDLKLVKLWISKSVDGGYIQKKFVPTYGLPLEFVDLTCSEDESLLTGTLSVFHGSGVILHKEFTLFIFQPSNDTLRSAFKLPQQKKKTPLRGALYPPLDIEIPVPSHERSIMHKPYDTPFTHYLPNLLYRLLGTYFDSSISSSRSYCVCYCPEIEKSERLELELALRLSGGRIFKLQDISMVEKVWKKKRIDIRVYVHNSLQYQLHLLPHIQLLRRAPSVYFRFFGTTFDRSAQSGGDVLKVQDIRFWGFGTAILLTPQFVIENEKALEFIVAYQKAKVGSTTFCIPEDLISRIENWACSLAPEDQQARGGSIHQILECIYGLKDRSESQTGGDIKELRVDCLQTSTGEEPGPGELYSQPEEAFETLVDTFALFHLENCVEYRRFIVCHSNTENLDGQTESLFPTIEFMNPETTMTELRLQLQPQPQPQAAL